MFISQTTTALQHQMLSTRKPVSMPAMLCWSITTDKSVRGQQFVRGYEMKQGVCPT
jgi:hypothetical protein